VVVAKTTALWLAAGVADKEGAAVAIGVAE
jgi:hypothetical protein